MDGVGNRKDKHEADLERIQRLCLMDDDFMNCCFSDNTECVELVLHIILDRTDLRVQEVQTQYTMKNLQGRSLKLDILATDESGKRYNIELQRDSRGAGVKRARYHSSIMDANILLAGEDFASLPETYVIFITEHDFFKKGKALYRIERCVLELEEEFGDGSHILYVNGECKDDTPLGKLMYDFSCADPADMNYDILAERTRFYKEEKEGISVMSRIFEEVRMEGLIEGRMEGRIEGQKERTIVFVQNLLAEGTLPMEKIAEVSDLTYDEVKEIAESN